MRQRKSEQAVTPSATKFYYGSAYFCGSLFNPRSPKTNSPQLAIQWFQDTGWNYVHGAVIAPEGVAAEREDFRAVVLKGRWRRRFGA